MTEKYTRPAARGAEPTYSAAEVGALLGRLLPRVDGEIILCALQAEDSCSTVELSGSYGADPTPEASELARVRRVFLVGEGAQVVRHAMSNTLTALQTEAQLLELEPLADEHRRAATRIVELTRRLATVMRQLDPGGTAHRTA
jgi:signal transduction histidine kinase